MTEPNSSQCVKAAFIWDGVSSVPLEDAYLIWNQGVITDVTTTPVADAIDLENAAIIPPLVNAHTHLEFSHLQHPITPAIPFTGWIGQTIAERAGNQNVQRSIELGVNESTKSGVAMLGEIVTHSQLEYTANPTGTSLLLFRELIGLTPETVKEQTEIVSGFLERYRHQHPLGLSPHAPYTVRMDLLQQCIKWACDFNLPLTMHLAETQAELDFMKSGTGELVEMLTRFDLWDSQMIEAGTRPLDYLRLLSQAPRTLLAHGNYFSDEEIDFLSDQPEMSVIYCPRTHAFFQHKNHRWREMLQAGINVALGTDGRGSSPDLSIWKEMQFLGRNASASQAAEILRMGTVNGWRACGDHVSIEAGQRACWTVIRSPADSRGRFTGWENLLGPDTQAETVNYAGQWMPGWWHTDSESSNCDPQK